MRVDVRRPTRLLQVNSGRIGTSRLRATSVLNMRADAASKGTLRLTLCTESKMKRRLILSARELRETIVELTSPKAGRRVIATAFVGPDALEYIPHPNGTEIYCWDHPSGTDPEGVADLMQDATVWFVSGLHMKVYWSERRGVLIGSPNLSRNALGDASALLEAAIYYDDSAAVDIRKIEALIKPKRRPAKDYIEDLRLRANKDPIARRGGGRRPARTVRDYFSMKHPAAFRIAFWSGTAGEHKKEDYEAVVGVHGIADISDARDRLSWSIPAPRGTAEGDWLLTVVWPKHGKPGSPINWMNVARVATVSDGRRAYELRGPKRPAPFNCKEKGFATALRRFLIRNPGDDDCGMLMTPKRIRKLADELEF